jgi:hypothetical protein
MDTFEIELDGEKVQLELSSKALEALSAYGGVLPTMQALTRYDIGAYVAVIRAGTKKGFAFVANFPGQNDKLLDKVFQTGVLNLIDPLIEYCDRLTNAGKPTKKPAEEKAT